MPIAADDVQSNVIAAFLDHIPITDFTANRVYPNVIPQTVSHQFCVVVSLVNVDRFRLLGGYNGNATSLLQVDSYGDVKVDVNALSKACKLRIINHGGLLGSLVVRGIRLVGEFDLPSGAAVPPADGSDRWPYRRALRFEIDYCEDTQE